MAADRNERIGRARHDGDEGALGVRGTDSGLGSSSWYRSDFRPSFGANRAAGDGDLLEVVFALTPPRFLRRMPSRETFSWPGEGWIVKRMRGDAQRDRWYDRPRERRRSPARREAEALIGLRRDGVPVPEALAWADESGGAARSPLEERSAVVMERIEFARTMRDRLTELDGKAVRPLAEALLTIVIRLHARGWIHRDLYLQHIVLRSDSEAARSGKPDLVVLDAGRALRSDVHRKRWFIKDLAALLASTPESVPRSECIRFLVGWMNARGIESRRARRRWARVIVRKARRIRSHVPRHLDPHDPVDAEYLAQSREATET